MKTLVILASVLLALAVLGIVFAAESNVPAQVSVNGFTSVTITPCVATLNFGSGNPGANDLPVTCQNATAGAVAVKNDPVSNGNIIVSAKGTNFTSSGNSIDVSRIEFDEANAKSSPINLTTSYQQSSTGVVPGQTVGIWYWLDIPSGQASGSYAGTLSVQGV